MVQRRDTGVTRHTGGWIVLAAGLLAACLLGAWTGDAFSLLSEDSLRSGSVGDGNSPATSGALDGFPELSIDINQADEAELSCIAGIGPALAQRIVEYRQRVGRFTTMAELENVPGVGPSLAGQLRRAIQPLPETESDIVVVDPPRLVGRHIKLPSNEPLHD